MKTLTLNLPDFLEVDTKDLKLLIASKLYESGKLSIGQAAEIVGITKRAFIELLGNYNVSLFNLTPEELEEDYNNA